MNTNLDEAINRHNSRQRTPVRILLDKSNYGLFATLPLYSLFFESKSLENMLESKTETYQAVIANLGLLFEERDKIRDGNINSIRYFECVAGSNLRRQETLRNYDGKRKQELEKLLSQLDTAQREEKIKCWQDKASLVKEALQALGGFSKSKVKSEMVGVMNTPD